MVEFAEGLGFGRSAELAGSVGAVGAGTGPANGPATDSKLLSQNVDLIRGLEDFVKLATRVPQSPMTGIIDVDARLDIPPGEAEVIVAAKIFNP